MSKTWGTLISSISFLLQLQHYQSKRRILLIESALFDSFTFQSTVMLEGGKMSKNNIAMMLMISPFAGNSCRGSGSGCASSREQCISSTLFFFLYLQKTPIMIVFLQAKLNKTFLAANYPWDEIKGGTLSTSHVLPVAGRRSAPSTVFQSALNG